MHISTHLYPPPSVGIQDPCILQSVVIVINPTSNQQLGMLFSIVEAAGSVTNSLHRPGGSLKPLQFGPLLEQVTQYIQGLT